LHQQRWWRQRQRQRQRMIATTATAAVNDSNDKLKNQRL
jgi:hypothetical protein